MSVETVSQDITDLLAAMLAEQFSKLQLSEKAALSIEHLGQDYILHIDAQPCSKCGNSARVAISSALNTIRLYSRANLAYTATIQAHEAIVTGVRFSPQNHELLYSCSRDGTIKCWDMRAKYDKPSQTFQGDLTGEERMLTAFDISCDGTTLCAGTDANKFGDSHLLFWDNRKSDRSRIFSDCHQQDITSIRFHPHTTQTVISAATDGLVNLFDLKEAEEDDALLTSFNTETSANVIGWCGQSFDNIYCTTHTETLHIWDSKEFEDILSLTDTRDQFKEEPVIVEYLVDCVAQNNGDMPYLLCGNHSGQLHLFALEGGRMKYMSSLTGGHRDDIRCTSWDSQNNSLLTGGDDGMLCLWTAEGVPPAKPKAAKAKSKVKTKHRGPVTATSRPYHKK